MSTPRFLLLLIIVVMAACGTSTASPHARVDYASTSFYDVPFPDEHLRNGDGTIDVGSFPEDYLLPEIENHAVHELKAALIGASGFGRSSGIFFALTQEVDRASLPDMAGSATAGASVFLMDVDPSTSERGMRWPVTVSFESEGGSFGADNMLSLLPLQGNPLRPNRLYAAVMTTGVRMTTGAAFVVAPATATLVGGGRPLGLSDAAYAAHRDAIDGLVGAGVDPRTIAATAVFRTGDPTAALRAARDQVLAWALPTPEAPFAATGEVFPDFCVFHTTIRLPMFQGGTPPYLMPDAGGAWVYNGDGELVLQDEALSNVWLTVPRAAMPAHGFPTVMFVRAGGGGDRPLIDRGPQATEDAPLSVPGAGPAAELARIGYAGISADGPLGGLRNTGGWDEQFAIFSVDNPIATRDTVRQSALELVLFAHVLPLLRADATSCPGFTTPAGDGMAALDVSTLAVMSHSTGSTIAPLAVAVDPIFRALVAGGAGGSWIENVLYKTSPIDAKHAAELVLGYTDLTEHDVIMSLMQWAGEPADPQLYASLIVTEPPDGHARDVLLLQGLLDTYIPPPVANALSLSLGVDLAGNELDVAYPQYTPLSAELQFTAGAAIDLPASGNRGSGAVTAVVTQLPGDGIVNAHELMFQTDAPKRQYRCFLQSRLTGVARVPSGAGDPATCD